MCGKPRPGRDEARPLNVLEWRAAGLPPCSWVWTDPKTGEMEFLKVGKPGELVPLELPERMMNQARRDLMEHWGH